MDYPSLINCIQSNATLSKAVLELVSRTQFLNLVTLNWKDALEGSEVYQKHVSGKVEYTQGRAVANEKAYNRRIKDQNEWYSVIVAGEWALDRDENSDDYSIVSRFANAHSPLHQITVSMRESERSSVHDGGRFFVRECNPHLCSDCRMVYSNLKMAPPRKNWCVKSIRIFDGKQISIWCTKRFQEVLVNMTFMGVLKMVVQSRTTFGNNYYKIGGTIHEMILFQHSVLLPSISVYLEPSMNLPSIEFPEEAGKKDEDVGAVVDEV